MDVAQEVVESAEREWAEEIERAVDNVTRSAWDKWSRRKWYRAGGPRRKGWAGGRGRATTPSVESRARAGREAALPWGYGPEGRTAKDRYTG